MSDGYNTHQFIRSQRGSMKAINEHQRRGDLDARLLAECANRNSPIEFKERIIADTVLYIANLDPEGFSEYLTKNRAEHLCFLSGTKVLSKVIGDPNITNQITYSDGRFVANGKSPDIIIDAANVATIGRGRGGRREPREPRESRDAGRGQRGGRGGGAAPKSGPPRGGQGGSRPGAFGSKSAKLPVKLDELKKLAESVENAREDHNSDCETISDEEDVLSGTPNGRPNGTPSEQATQAEPKSKRTKSKRDKKLKKPSEYVKSVEAASEPAGAEPAETTPTSEPASEPAGAEPAESEPARVESAPTTPRNWADAAEDGDEMDFSGSPFEGANGSGSSTQGANILDDILGGM